MRKFLLSLSFLLLGAGLAALGQVPMTHGGKGAPGGGGGGYTGPGDVAGSALVAGGLICYSTSTNTAIADIADSATGNTTGTRLQCGTGGVISALVSGSACTFITGNACSTLATTCAVACSILTLYDQTGSGVPLTNTVANAPRITTSCLGALNCMTGTPNQTLQSAATITHSQPFTLVTAVKRTSAAGAYALASNNNDVGLGGTASANTAALFNSFNTAAITATMSDNAWHVLQGVFNGASPNSILSVDGSSTTGTTSGTMSGTVSNFSDGGSSVYTGSQLYIAAYGSAFSGTQLTNMSSTIHSIGGF